MSFTNLGTLKASVLAWTERSGDPAAESIVEDCVTLCEARLNKMPALRISDMESFASTGLVDETTPLPDDFLAMKLVIAASSPWRVLSYAEPSWYHTAYTSSGTDDGCDFYTIIGTSIFAKSSASLTLTYYAKLPPLVIATDTNWLLSRAPDVYLYGTIMELLNALEGDATQKYAGLFQSAVESLLASETFSRGGVLTVRASMPAP